MKLLLILLLLVPAVIAVPWFVQRPLRSIVTVYAGTLPIASVVSVEVPLPPPFNTLSSILGALAIGACVAHVALYRQGRVPSLPVALWAVFLGWCLTTVFWAIDGGAAVEEATVAIPLILLLLAISIVPADRGDYDTLRVAVVLSGIIVGAYAFYLLITGAALPSHGVEERFSLATGVGETNPNILAASLLLPLAVSVEMILLGGGRWWTPRSWRVLGVTGTFFIFVALFLTGSRGGLVAAAVTFFATLLYGRRLSSARPWIRRTVVAFFALALALPVGALIAESVTPQNTISRLLALPPIQRLLNPQLDSSGRTDIWTAGLVACRAYCAGGAGFGNFSDAFNERFAFSAASKSLEFDKAAHNVYLAVAVETGFVGLTLLGLALLAEWMALMRRGGRERLPSLRAAILGLLVANVFLSAIWFKYFWLVFAFARVAEASLPGGPAPGAAPSPARRETPAPSVSAP
jgi:O-antigen ligase